MCFRSVNGTVFSGSVSSLGKSYRRVRDVVMTVLGSSSRKGGGLVKRCC